MEKRSASCCGKGSLGDSAQRDGLLADLDELAERVGKLEAAADSAARAQSELAAEFSRRVALLQRRNNRKVPRFPRCGPVPSVSDAQRRPARSAPFEAASTSLSAMIEDFVAREGYKEVLFRLGVGSDAENAAERTPELRAAEEEKRIMAALRRRSLDEALAYCAEHKSQLRRMQVGAPPRSTVDPAPRSPVPFSHRAPSRANSTFASSSRSSAPATSAPPSRSPGTMRPGAYRPTHLTLPLFPPAAGPTWLR